MLFCCQKAAQKMQDTGKKPQLFTETSYVKLFSDMLSFAVTTWGEEIGVGRGSFYLTQWGWLASQQILLLAHLFKAQFQDITKHNASTLMGRCEK